MANNSITTQIILKAPAKLLISFLKYLPEPLFDEYHPNYPRHLQALPLIPKPLGNYRPNCHDHFPQTSQTAYIFWQVHSFPLKYYTAGKKSSCTNYRQSNFLGGRGRRGRGLSIFYFFIKGCVIDLICHVILLSLSAVVFATVSPSFTPMLSQLSILCCWLGQCVSTNS